MLGDVPVKDGAEQGFYAEEQHEQRCGTQMLHTRERPAQLQSAYMVTGWMLQGPTPHSRCHTNCHEGTGGPGGAKVPGALPTYHSSSVLLPTIHGIFIVSLLTDEEAEVDA